MAKTLTTTDQGFAAAFASLLAEKREVSADVDLAVAGIIKDVRARGDRALIELSQMFDSVDLGKLGLQVTAAEVDAAVGQCSKETLDALDVAAGRITAHHQRQLPESTRYCDALGVELGDRWTAVAPNPKP